MYQLYEFVRDRILSGMALTVRQTHGRVTTLKDYQTEQNGNRILLRYSDRVTVTVTLGEESVLFSIDANLPYHNGTSHALLSEEAISLTLGDATPDAILGSHHDCPWWMMPSFPKSYAEIRPQTQSLLVKLNGLNYHLLPLCGENFRCEMRAGQMSLTSDMAGLYRLHGAFLSVSVSAEPLSAVEANYRGARALGGINVPLRSERTLPEHFNKFGWCTWDSFYRDVTIDKICEKLTEFREKGIPVKWMIIDDGWMQTQDSRLCNFEVDRTKFPEGLKAAIDKIKGEFGVEKVGVWHAFNGYWEGVKEGSPLYEAQKENLFRTVTGHYLPSMDEEKAFRFWDTWHSYLADCGVDFLKVDNQSSNSAMWEGTLPTAEGCRVAHRPIERSILKNFGGAVINCMGMDMENNFARPYSAVTRNSDDFFPRRERGFIKHLTQNVYNAIWDNQMYYCDFDMWWSDHESAYQSGVLRAISGSPIYVSDEIGRSCAETIAPVVESDGTVMRCDYAARPTDDCVYTDCSAENNLLKIWNRSADAYALAVFNVSDGDVTDTVSLDTIPELPRDTEFIAYEYFTKTATRVNACSDFTVTLPRDGVQVWSIYPIIHPDETTDDSAYIMMGDVGKYVPIASAYKVKRMLSEF